MGKIRDFFSRIFRRQPKMLNSAEKQEVVEFMSSSNREVKDVIKEEMKTSSFKEELKKQAEVSKIDPSRYENTTDLYMAILEEMGISENFKDNPKAKEDLSNMVKDIIGKQPEYQQQRLLKPQSKAHSDELMDILKSNIGISSPSEISYRTPYKRQSYGPFYESSKVKYILQENGKYTKRNLYETAIPDSSKKTASVNGLETISEYDRDGIENKRQKIELATFNNIECHFEDYGDKLSVVNDPYGSGSYNKNEIVSKLDVTRNNSLNGDHNNLADLVTAHLIYTVNSDYNRNGERPAPDTTTGYVTIDFRDLASLDDNYESIIDFLRKGDREAIKSIDKYHDWSGKPLSDDLVKRDLGKIECGSPEICKRMNQKIEQIVGNEEVEQGN